MAIVLNAAGGLGIFLLAMAMMTDGLKVFGGEGLKRLLERWTSTSIKAALTGAMVTGIVQSSSAVTVATIGFANAGILTLRQSLGVIFGANVGTTMTGWLVSLVGFGFKIEAFALPIIAIGMALRVAVQGKRGRGLGEALAGFGLFFLGLSVLKDAFSGLATSFGMATLNDTGAGGVVLFALAGLVATVLTQSSSAAIALILTAASESAIGLGAAAAAIIGANIGTTSTAAFAVINATPNARRVATGHIVFNVATGIIAFLILPVLLWSVGFLGHMLGLSDHPTVILALFHTVFNLVGVGLMLPFVGPLAARLEHFFTTQEEDIRRPHHLDSTVASTPAFAVPALQQELMRMHDLVCTTAVIAIDSPRDSAFNVERRAAALFELGKAVRSFAVTVRMEGMSRDLAETIPRQLRISRYLEEAAQLLSQVHAIGVEGRRLPDTAAKADIQRLLAIARDCVAMCGETGSGENWQTAMAATSAQFEGIYQDAKASILRAAATHHLPIEDVDRLLDAGSAIRRMVEQLIKATTMLKDQTGRQGAEDGLDPENA
ncbi:Na/Pi symporter [Emcibacter sp. SYSU 3D8]|uniref:Na/Pi cotransporter family protein n=1 Tax=Emcibacter sp. SYSU 3D8 TaxID=3133969 RepID=UPI0031FECFA0